jgi:lambda family phage tail tape measure protein
LKESTNLWAGMAGGLRDWAKEAQKTGKQASEAITGLLTQSIDGLSSSISRAIVYGEDLGESLKNVAMSAVESLIKMAIQMAITAAVAAILVNLILGAGQVTTANALSAGASVSAAAGGMANSGNTQHEGGPIYHNGGPVYPGRRPDEVRATLQTGEYVLSRRDVEELKRGVAAPGQPTTMPGGPSVERVVVLSEDDLARRWASPAFRVKIQNAAGA